MNNENLYGAVLEIEHPEMQLGSHKGDKRLDTPTTCEYTENTETYD